MSPLPSGTVTFLFTDIEGSTRLWDRSPELMQLALVRHDDLVRAAIERHRGRVFKTIGDAFCAAFATAADGLAAALSSQRAIAEEPWEAGAPIRVRIALHTGRADERGGDYYGPALNRCARLLGVAHGGQTILSGTTMKLLAQDLPDGVTLIDLSTHRLRDLTEPEHVFQLVHPDLPSDFPPLISLTSHPNNLPVRPNRFIGRHAESAATRALLDRTSLLTLTGAGGSGKTRLALQVAADQVDRFPDGVWLVELAALEDAALVPQTVGAAMGLRQAPGMTMQATLIERLKPQQVLVILDNCEHLIAFCARVAEALLRACPDLKIVATSREALGITGEVLYLVPPLSIPARPASRRAPARLEDYLHCEAVELFVERASESAPGFALTPANAPAVAEICRCLDGVALAIELAAARVRVLSPEQIATRLGDHLRLLTAGRRDLLPRQQTMRAAVDWSYVLLPEAEQLLLGRLAVFVGGWTLEMAEALGGGGAIETDEVLDLLANLVDKSLVVVDADGAARRYRMFEAIRQYALEKLALAGDEPRLRRGHLAWCLAFAEASPAALDGAELAERLARIEAEHDNLRSALAWSAANGAEAQGLQLAAELWVYWYMRGYLSEGRRHLDLLLSAADAAAVEPGIRASGLKALGALAYYQGDYATARRAWEDSLAIGRAQGDVATVEQLLNNLGSVLRAMGEYAAARQYGEQTLAMARERGDRTGVVTVLRNLALLAFDQGQLAAAHALLDECLTLQQTLSDPLNVALSQCAMAGIRLLAGDYEEARADGEASLHHLRALGHDYGTAEVLEVLARIACELGDLSRALDLAGECLAIRRELGDTQGVAEALSCLALAHLRAGDDDLAEPLLREALPLAREVAYQRSVASALQLTGCLATRRADHLRAAACYREALEIGRDLNSVWIIACTVEGMVGLALAQSDARCALRLAGAVDALRAQIEAPRPPAVAIEIESWVATARERLDAAGADAAWSEGRDLGVDLGLEAVVDYASGRPA